MDTQTATITKALQIRDFNRFYTNIIGIMNQTILDSPYSLAEARILVEIQTKEQCTATDLTKLLHIDPGYFSRIIRRLRKDGLIISAKSPSDGRAQLLTLTTLGQQVFHNLTSASTTQIVEILNRLLPSEQDRLVYHMLAIRQILHGPSASPAIIRSYHPGDAGYIAYRHGVLYHQEYGFDKVFEQYVITSLHEFMSGQQSGNIWIAEADSRPVGCIGIVGCDQNTAQLRWFLLEPEFRGTGLGSKLLAVAMDYCRQQQYKNVYLWTFRGLDAARHLYRKFGFLPTEEKPNTTWSTPLTEERWDITLET